MGKSTKSALKIITIKHVLVQSQPPTNNRTVIKIFHSSSAKKFWGQDKPRKASTQNWDGLISLYIKRYLISFKIHFSILHKILKMIKSMSPKIILSVLFADKHLTFYSDETYWGHISGRHSNHTFLSRVYLPYLSMGVSFIWANWSVFRCQWVQKTVIDHMDFKLIKSLNPFFTLIQPKIVVEPNPNGVG